MSMKKINLLKTRILNLPIGVKASIAFFISSLATKGIAYIITPIYTRLLTPSEYGQVSVFLTWMQIFGIIAMFCLSYGVFNNGMVDYPNRRDEYSFSMLALSNIITIVFLIVIKLLFPLIKDFFPFGFQYILLMCVVFMFQPAYNFWMARQRYEYKYKGVMVWAIICSVISPLVAIVLMFAQSRGDRLAARLFGAEGALITIYFLFYLYLGYKSKWKIKTEFWKSALLFNLPLIPHYLSTYLLGSSDQLMISYLDCAESTAYYSLAYSVATTVTIVWTAVNGSLIPYTYEKCKLNDYKSINKVTIPILIVFGIACCCLILLAPEVVYIMAPAEYQQAIYIIPPVVGGVFFQIQYFIYSNIVYYYKKPVYVMVGSVTAVIMNIILNYIGISMFGYMAAGYTTLICYIIQACIDYFAMRKVVGANVYNMKLIIMISSVMVAISLLSGVIYDIPLVRYLILIVIACLLFAKRKLVVRILNGTKM